MIIKQQERLIGGGYIFVRATKNFWHVPGGLLMTHEELSKRLKRKLEVVTCDVRYKEDFVGKTF